MRVRTVGGAVKEEAFPSFPRFYDGVGHMLVGEAVYVEGDESASGELTRVRALPKPRGNKRAIVLTLDQVQGGAHDGQMRLTVTKHPAAPSTRPDADVNWNEWTLLVRRSETPGKVMNTTKTNLLQKIGLPDDLMSILMWHSDRLDASIGPMRDSELLFPLETGGFRAASCLDRPFDTVCEKLGLKKDITARAMRRTFNDLCRKAQVESVVTRSISGHATEQMKQHYETVNVEEKRQNLARVISLAGFRQAFLRDGVGAPEPTAAGAGEAA